MQPEERLCSKFLIKLAGPAGVDRLAQRRSQLARTVKSCCITTAQDKVPLSGELPIILHKYVRAIRCLNKQNISNW